MIDELSALLNRPLIIGPKTIPNRLVLAPMTFLGHVVFRQVLDDCPSTRHRGCLMNMSDIVSFDFV